MISLQKLKNSHKGKSAVYLGIGPSINYFDLSKINREKHVLFSMNYWYPYGPQIFGFDVDYYFNADSGLFFRNFYNHINAFHFMKNGKSRKRDPLKFVNTSKRKEIIEKKLKNNLINCSPYEWIKNNETSSKIILLHREYYKSCEKEIEKKKQLFYGKIFDDQKSKILYKEDKNIVTFNSHSFSSGFTSYITSLVQYLGFKELIIMGIDCSNLGYFFFDLNENIKREKIPKNFTLKKYPFKRAAIEMQIKSKLLENMKIYEIDPGNYPYYFNSKIFPRIKFDNIC